MFEAEIESLQEALGYNDRDTDGVELLDSEYEQALENLVQTVEEYGQPLYKVISKRTFLADAWWLEVTTDPDRFDSELCWIGSPTAGEYRRKGTERWDIVTESNDVVTDLPRGNGKHKSVPAPENAWLANLSILAVNENGNELTKEQTRAALRIWFPKTTRRKDGSYGTADIAFHSTFLNFLPSGTRVRAYCAPCRRELFLDNSMDNLLATVEHALTHYNGSRVSFYTDGLGYRRFRLTGSSINSEQALSDSFSEDVTYWDKKSQQAHQAGQHALAHTFSERAQWYRKAASVIADPEPEPTHSECNTPSCERYSHTGYHVREDGQRSLDGEHWVSIEKVVTLSKLLTGKERHLLAQSIKLLGWA